MSKDIEIMLGMVYTFSLALSVKEVHVIFKKNNLQSLSKVLLHLKKHEFCLPNVSLSEIA